jgi:hypothetical protein
MLAIFNDIDPFLTTNTLHIVIKMEKQQENIPDQPKLRSAHESHEGAERIASEKGITRRIMVETGQECYGDANRKEITPQALSHYESNDIKKETKAYSNTSDQELKRVTKKARRVTLTSRRNHVRGQETPKSIPHKIRFQGKNQLWISNSRQIEMQSRNSNFVDENPSSCFKDNSSRGEQNIKKAHVKRFGKQLTCQLIALKQTYEQALTDAENVCDDENKMDDSPVIDLKRPSESNSKQIDDPTLKGYDGDEECDDEISNESL